MEANSSIIENLENSYYLFPSGSQSLVSNIAFELRTSERKHKLTTHSIKNWCEASIPVLQSYVSLFDDWGKAFIQRLMLVQVLKNGVEQMNHALDELNSCITYLNSASGEISQLDNEVESTRRSETNRLQAEKIEATHPKWWEFLIPILVIVGQIKTHTETIPLINREIEHLEDLYNQLRGYVRNVENEIKSARNELRREITALDNLRCEASVTRRFTELTQSQKVLIKLHANSLITKCRSYVASVA